MKGKTDRLLLTFFVGSMAFYVVIFATAFSSLPLNIPSWHQFLLLFFHFVPMFFLQLLLCRRAKLRWKLLCPLILLLVPGLVFLNGAEWDLMAWIFFLFWCIAPVAGSVLAWVVWAVAAVIAKKATKNTTA